jgi:hypothetical protein
MGSLNGGKTAASAFRDCNNWLRSGRTSDTLHHTVLKIKCSSIGAEYCKATRGNELFFYLPTGANCLSNENVSFDNKTLVLNTSTAAP